MVLSSSSVSWLTAMIFVSCSAYLAWSCMKCGMRTFSIWASAFRRSTSSKDTWAHGETQETGSATCWGVNRKSARTTRTTAETELRGYPCRHLQTLIFVYPVLKPLMLLKKHHFLHHVQHQQLGWEICLIIRAPISSEKEHDLFPPQRSSYISLIQPYFPFISHCLNC